MRRRGFTLVEAIISLLMITVITIALCRFGNTLSAGFAKTAKKSQEFMQEYQDVISMRANDKIPVLNNNCIIQVEHRGVMEIVKYNGKYIVFYKLYGVDSYEP